MGESKWGVRRVLAQLHEPDEPAIWLDLVGVDCEDEVAVGDAFSEAVMAGLGAPLFGFGVGFDYGVAALAPLVPIIEPLTIAISMQSPQMRWIDGLLAVAKPPNRLLVYVEAAFGSPPVGGPWHEFDLGEFAVTEQEAVEMFGLERDESEISRAVLLHDGAILAVEEHLALNVSSRRDINDAANGRGSRAVDWLIRQRRWLDAFELAVFDAPHRAVEVIAHAGSEYLSTGQYERFWRHIDRLPRAFLREPEVRYWHFSAAVAANKWTDHVEDVDRYLGRNEAPRLRALRSMTVVDGRSEEGARRAYASEPCAHTAAALGFVLLVKGHPGQAVGVLREALELAEHDADSRLVVNAALYSAMAEVSLGHYESGRNWATWALRRFDATGMREELLRLSLISVASYAAMLTGNLASAKQHLSTVSVDEKWLGIPSVEGIVSTLGDLSLVEGDPTSALNYYEMNLRHFGNGAKPTLLLDVVRGLIRAGQTKKALEIAAELHQITRGDAETAKYGELAQGLAHAAIGDATAEGHLLDALDHFLQGPFGVGPAEASVNLAAKYLSDGRTEDAVAALKRAQPFLRDLGESGWKLIAPTERVATQLHALWRGDAPGIVLALLGQSRIVREKGETALSPRFAELFTVLAAHSDGIRGEALAVALYGERANQSTLKATVSRARRLVPIDAGPYRIAEPFRADFMEVLSLLQHGRVQAALELYRGPLLPASEAPMVVELRGYLEESLRQAVLSSDDPDALIDFANQQGEDLQLWEEALRQLPPNDPRRPLVNARIRRIRKGW